MANPGRPFIEPGAPDGAALNPVEQRNVARLERWRDLFNGDDMELFVREAYAPTFRVVNLDGTSWTANSNHRENILENAEVFIGAETAIKRAAPGRHIRFNRVIPAGDVITLEASLLDHDRPDWELSWCGIYTFDNTGLIISDHTYLNHRDWPGITELLG